MKSSALIIEEGFTLFHTLKHQRKIHRMRKHNGLHRRGTDDQLVPLKSQQSALIRAHPGRIGSHFNVVNHTITGEAVTTSIGEGTAEESRLLFGWGAACAVSADGAV